MFLLKCTNVNKFLFTKSTLDSELLLSLTDFYQRIFQTADHFQILLLSLPATNSLANFEPKPVFSLDYALQKALDFFV